MRLKIRHNAEIAHRLSLDEGKCKQIHGHGLQIELLFMDLEEGEKGMAKTRFGSVLEFGSMKYDFRAYIDNTYDHHLILNEDDEWAKGITNEDRGGEVPGTNSLAFDPHDFEMLPGLTTVPGEPTVENMAKWIAEWAAKFFKTDIVCRVDETKTNGAEVYVVWNGTETRVRR